jgi:hypothetical protein
MFRNEMAVRRMRDSAMAGGTDLTELLSGMRPRLDERSWVFAALDTATVPAGLRPILQFREAEGLTVVVEAGEAAQAGLQPLMRARMITLDVHSSLEAVGFLAAILPRLAAAGIGVNPVSAAYHDHLFVPQEQGARALALLQEIAAEARAATAVRPPSSWAG